MRTIKSEDEYVTYCAEVVNRQNEANPMMVDVSKIFDRITDFDWDREYLTIRRVDDKLMATYEVVDVVTY